MAKMKNSKTTIAGFLTLGSACISLVAAILTGSDLIAVIVELVVPALAGVGLISASDGGF